MYKRQGLVVAANASQLKEVSRRAEIDAIGIMCTEGIIKGNENGGFVCMDETISQCSLVELFFLRQDIIRMQ